MMVLWLFGGLVFVLARLIGPFGAFLSLCDFSVLGFAPLPRVLGRVLDLVWNESVTDRL